MATEDGILVATHSFWHGNKMVRKGATARAGHPLVETYPRLFEPLTIDFDHEEPPTSRHAKRDEPKGEEAPTRSVPKSSNVKFANPPTRKK
jgi:hypothetical protein